MLDGGWWIETRGVELLMTCFVCERVLHVSHIIKGANDKFLRASYIHIYIYIHIHAHTRMLYVSPLCHPPTPQLDIPLVVGHGCNGSSRNVSKFVFVPSPQLVSSFS